MRSVLYYIDRANQRGGRMLSVIDLIERETLSVRQMAWLLKKIEEWMKTGCLINTFLPSPSSFR